MSEDRVGIVAETEWRSIPATERAPGTIPQFMRLAEPNREAIAPRTIPAQIFIKISVEEAIKMGWKSGKRQSFTIEADGDVYTGIRPRKVRNKPYLLFTVYPSPKRTTP